MNKEKAFLRPAQYFQSPHDVISSTLLTKEEKKTVLLNWKQQCEQLYQTEQEGMRPAGAREKLKLQEVSEAIRSIY